MAYDTYLINLHKRIKDYYDTLTESEKSLIYLEDYIFRLGRTHSFYINLVEPKGYPLIFKGMSPVGLDTKRNTLKCNENIGYQYGYIKEVCVMFDSIDDFCSPDRIELIDKGTNWEERGFAHRYFLKAEGIYEHIKNIVK